MQLIPKAVAVAVLAAYLVAPGSPARASFHEMQIEQVIGGVDGDVTAQAIQLRMLDHHQSEVSLARLYVRDAQGLNPVLIVDMHRNVVNHNLGDRVLIASGSFAAAAEPDAQRDFVMTSLIPQSYFAAGSLTFEDNSGTVYWRVSWGGENYQGLTTGNTLNDTDPGSPADFGPPFAGPLPSDGRQALLFTGPAFALSTTNEDDYAVTDGPAIFVNNARLEFSLAESDPIPGDINGDAKVDIHDYAICAPCLAGPEVSKPPLSCLGIEFIACDLNGDWRVDLADFADFALLITSP